MKITLNMLVSGLLLLPLLLPLTGCGGSCGFDCNSNDDNNNPALLTLGLSDSLPEDLKKVVIQVDTITLRRSGVDPIVIDTFTIKQLGLVDAASFQVDLLNYRGVNQLLVIEGLELPTGTYDSVSISIQTGGINQSYVQEDNDTLKAIRVASGVLTLPGITLSSGAQPFTVEFGLAQALQYQNASGTYLLSNSGVRIANNLTSATLAGTVNSALFNTVSPCSQKTNPLKGNRVYLYSGGNLLGENLADVFTSASTVAPPANAVAPFAVASMANNSLTGFWEYAFGFIPAGTYTIAFACDTQTDDSVEYNALTIPLPVTQKYEITLTAAQKGVCNLAEGGSC
jgi:Domain of unknown function (DUF4382)